MPKKSRKDISEDARGKRRVLYEQAVMIRCKDWTEFRAHYAENLSEGGIFIHQEKPFSPGTYFTLNVKVAEEELALEAQVVWTKEFNSEDGRPSGIGARFLNLDEKKLTVLRRFIELADPVEE